LSAPASSAHEGAEPEVAEQRSVARPAVFLDRDGTLIEDVDYLVRPEQLELLPGAARAVRLLNEARVPAVVVTNQSAVARGMLSEAQLAVVHARFEELLAQGGARLDAILYCPHHPELGTGEYKRACRCRKPAPGMLEEAAKRLDLDLGRSIAIGDALRDLEAGAAVGARGILVGTGKGAEQRARAARAGFACEPDVLSAVRRALAELGA
jgi:D-glycero-D-manno-heptose 1,7-bisphosphate phosphatase